MTTEERLTHLESQNRKLKRLFGVFALGLVSLVAVAAAAPEKPLEFRVWTWNGKPVAEAADGNLTVPNHLEVGSGLKVHGVDIGETLKKLATPVPTAKGEPAFRTESSTWTNSGEEDQRNFKVLLTGDHPNREGAQRESWGRFVSVPVKFARPFSAPPTILLSLTGFSGTPGSLNQIRYNLVPAEVTRDSFRITIDTWAHSTVAGVHIQWVAIGQ